MVPEAIKRRGVMLVLSSPSGTGKSTIARNLLAKEKNLELSVSVTTRARRGSEIDGTHYHFLSERDFERKRDSDALLEWVCDNVSFPCSMVDRITPRSTPAHRARR